MKPAGLAFRIPDRNGIGPEQRVHLEFYAAAIALFHHELKPLMPVRPHRIPRVDVLEHLSIEQTAAHEKAKPGLYTSAARHLPVFALAQARTLQLAGGGPRQLSDELNRSRILVRSDLRLDVILKVAPQSLMVKSERIQFRGLRAKLLKNRKKTTAEQKAGAAPG